MEHSRTQSIKSRMQADSKEHIRFHYTVQSTFARAGPAGRHETTECNAKLSRLFSILADYTEQIGHPIHRQLPPHGNITRHVSTHATSPTSATSATSATPSSHPHPRHPHHPRHQSHILALAAQPFTTRHRQTQTSQSSHMCLPSPRDS